VLLPGGRRRRVECGRRWFARVAGPVHLL